MDALHKQGNKTRRKLTVNGFFNFLSYYLDCEKLGNKEKFCTTIKPATENTTNKTEKKKIYQQLGYGFPKIVFNY